METVDDIERELREYGDRPPPRRAWIDLADRLHAAYKRDMQAIVDANETAMDEIAKLRKTIARLRKTNEVLECARDLWFERADELRRRCEALGNGGAK